MFLGIEFRSTKINGKSYWRIAPVCLATDKQKLWLGSFAVVVAFIISIMILDMVQP
jgi:hypothetical protein